MQDKKPLGKRVDTVGAHDKRPIDLKLIDDIEVDGIDRSDYPDFCDAFIQSATWLDTGDNLTHSELDRLMELYPDLAHELATESFQGGE